MKVIRQVGYDNVRIERVEIGVFGDAFVEVDESLHLGIRPLCAVGAVNRRAADECMDSANKVGTYFPFVRILRNGSKEEQDRETGAKFVFLETSTDSPFVRAVRRDASAVADGRRNMYTVFVTCRSRSIWSAGGWRCGRRSIRTSSVRRGRWRYGIGRTECNRVDLRRLRIRNVACYRRIELGTRT